MSTDLSPLWIFTKANPLPTKEPTHGQMCIHSPEYTTSTEWSTSLSEGTLFALCTFISLCVSCFMLNKCLLQNWLYPSPRLSRERGTRSLDRGKDASLGKRWAPSVRYRLPLSISNLHRCWCFTGCFCHYGRFSSVACQQGSTELASLPKHFNKPSALLCCMRNLTLRVSG